MKIVLTILNVLLGLALLVVNFQPRTLTAENAAGLLVGMASIIATIAFIKNKRFAEITLPLIPLFLALYMFFSAARLQGEATLTGGPMIIFGLILLLMSALEGSYVIFRKRT
jgi:predicted Na+-dependent transporter